MTAPFTLRIYSGILALVLICHCSLAETPDALLKRVAQARAEGLGAVMIWDLESMLAQSQNPSESAKLEIELARCLVEAGRGPDAIRILTQSNANTSAPARFWLAQALAQTGKVEAALKAYTDAASAPDFEYRAEAQLGIARMLAALNRPNDALAAFEAVPEIRGLQNDAAVEQVALLIEIGELDAAAVALDNMDNLRQRDEELQRYLDGCLALAAGDLKAAEENFQGFNPRNRRLVGGAVIGLAETLVQLGKPEEAATTLETFIQNEAISPLTPTLMAKLDEVYDAVEDPRNTWLRRWENDTNRPALAILASFYIGNHYNRTGRPDRAQRDYERFIENHPNHPLRVEAGIRLARLLLDQNQTAEAVPVLRSATENATKPREKAELAFLWGLANLDVGNYPEAATFFNEATQFPSLKPAALFNAALAETLADPNGDPGPSFAEIRTANPDQAESLLLTSALRQASKNLPSAPLALDRLSRGASSASIRRASTFALAEWRWMHGELTNLVPISLDDLTDNEAVFEVYRVDDGSPDAAQNVIIAARRFVDQNPDSPHEARVRMKWGEALSRIADHRAARLQFESAARAARDPELANSALFLAARSAARSMDPTLAEEALVLFDEVARSSSPLADQARLEQALLQSRSNKFTEAVILLDRLIESTSDPRLKITAALKKGDTLLASESPESQAQAIAAWQSVAANPSATPSERNEALTKIAAIAELSGDTDAAISGYYKVLNAPDDGPPETFWVFKAGFDAARLLEADRRHREAAAIYEKLAAKSGPRAQEAAEQVRRLRLENFIWDR